MSKKIPWIIAGVLIVVLVGGGIWYYTTKNAKVTPSYMLGTVKSGTVAKKINATGTIQYPTQYNLTFDGKSRLTKLNVSVGDTVKSGQVLAEVDSASANQQVLQAKASLSQAQLKVTQLKAGPAQADLLSAQNAVADAQDQLNQAKQKLSDDQAKNTTSAQTAIDSDQTAVDSAQRKYNLAVAKLDQVKAGSTSSDIKSAQQQVNQAQASLAIAQSALDDTKLVAPADGVITAVNGQVGEYPGSSSSGSSGSSSGGAAFIVLNGASSSMQIVVPADEADIGSVKAGQSVNITLPAFPDKTFSGSVSLVAPAGKTSNNVTTFDVTISADNKDKLMKAGMSANVSILIDQKQNVLMVPSEAVHGSGTEKTVMLPPAAGSTRPVSQAVEIGLDDGTNAEVISGLNDGQQVITGYRVTKSPTSSTGTTSGNRGGMGGFGGFGGGGGSSNRGTSGSGSSNRGD